MYALMKMQRKITSLYLTYIIFVNNGNAWLIMFVASLWANLISIFLAQYSRDCVMTIISVLEEPVYILLYK